MLRREFFEEPAVVHRDHVVVGGVVVVEPGGAHVAERFVVTVTFAIGTDAYQLRILAFFVPGVLDTAAECFCAAEQVFEAYRRRKPRVVEENVQVAVANENAVLVARVDAIRASRVDVGVATTGPLRVAKFAELVGLCRRKDGELDPRLDEFHHRFEVDGGFGEPHGFGHASEVEFEVFDAPTDLSLLVLLRGERHDDVVVDLGDCVAVAFQSLGTSLVRFLNSPIGIRSVRANPSHQGRTHVETHKVIVVDNIDNASVRRKNTACRIGTVTLASNAVVPVVKRACTGLVFDDACPGIFARRLVKMTVNRKIKGVLLFHTG